VSTPLVVLFGLTVVGGGGWFAVQTFGLPPGLPLGPFEPKPIVATREPRPIETPVEAVDAAVAELPDASTTGEEHPAAEAMAAAPTADAGAIAGAPAEDAGQLAVAPTADAGAMAVAVAAVADAGADHAEAPATPTRAGGSGVAVMLKSVPDAIVWIDGNAAGTTPLQLDLAAGSYKLRFDSPDAGLNKSILLRVPKGETFEKEFTFARANLTIQAPAGATVFLGRRKLGSAPLAPIEVYEGTYRIHVVDEKKSLDVTKTIEVKPGDVTAQVGME
jgi:hypothetical protein